MGESLDGGMIEIDAGKPRVGLMEVMDSAKGAKSSSGRLPGPSSGVKHVELVGITLSPSLFDNIMQVIRGFFSTNRVPITPP